MRPRFHGRHSSGRRPGGARRARRRIDRTSRKRRAITGGRVRIFYSPDLAYIHERAEALACVDLHVGDGASLDRSIVRKSGDALIGHAPVRTQLTWCQEERSPARSSRIAVRRSSRETKGRWGPSCGGSPTVGVSKAEIAYDGATIVLR